MHYAQILSLLEFFPVITQTDPEFDKISHEIRKNSDLAVSIFKDVDLKTKGSIAEALSNYGISIEKATTFEKDLKFDWPHFFKGRIKENHQEMRRAVFELNLVKSREYKTPSFYANIRRQHEYLLRRVEGAYEKLQSMNTRHPEYTHVKDSLSRLILEEKRSRDRKVRFEELEDLVNEETEMMRLQAMYVRMSMGKVRVVSSEKRTFRVIED